MASAAPIDAAAGPRAPAAAPPATKAAAESACGAATALADTIAGSTAASAACCAVSAASTGDEKGCGGGRPAAATRCRPQQQAASGAVGDDELALCTAAALNGSAASSSNANSAGSAAAAATTSPGRAAAGRCGVCPDDATDVDLPSLDGFFICREYETKTYQLGALTQCIDALAAASTDPDLTGQLVWLVSVLTATYIATRGEELQGKDVLELGAGAGLCGLAASQFAASVCLTDYEEEVLSLLQRNLRHVAPSCRGSVCDLAWGDDAAHAALAAATGIDKYPVLVGADIVYWSKSVAPLFASVKVCFRAQERNVAAR